MDTQQPVSSIDLKSTAVNGLKGAYRMLRQDLEALPEDAFGRSMGGKSRSIADFTYELIRVNEHIGMVIRGEEPWEWVDDGWIKAPENFRTKSEVLAGLAESERIIVETAEALSDEQLVGTVRTEHGDRTRFQRCQFMTLHMWYHSGQLNFIQTLQGDDAWHWN